MYKIIESDIVVVGGGPAGINAALAAARQGANTVLIERYGFLGGMSTVALVYPWMTFHTMEGKQVIGGIAQEIVDRLIANNGSPGHVRDTCGFVKTVTPYHPERYKLIALEMLRESGVKVIAHSMVDEAIVEDDTIKAVRVSTKSGRMEIRAQVFVDTTGDADLAFFAGAPCLKGRDSDGKTQPMTMKFRMKGVDLAAVKQYMLEHPDEFYKKTPVDELSDLPLTAVQGFYKHWKEANLPINRDQVLFFTGPDDDEIVVNMVRVQGFDGTDVEQLTEAEEQGRKQVFMISDFMVKSLPGFAKASVTQVGTQIGVRESRRINGEYMLTMEDVTRGRRFEDCIARSGYPIDIHDPSGKNVTAAWIDGDGAYDIPYGCLLPKKITNLTVGGRCISTTHEALATTRLTPSCMSTGQAAGTAAAMAAAQGVSPLNIDGQELRKVLVRNGALLD